MKSPCCCRLICIVAVNLLPLAALAADRAYDPLAVPHLGSIRTLDMTVSDEGRNREIPIRLHLPTQTTPQPVVLFMKGTPDFPQCGFSAQTN